MAVDKMLIPEQFVNPASGFQSLREVGATNTDEVRLDEDQAQQQEDKHGLQLETQTPPRKASSFCSFRFGVSVLLHFCNVAMVAQRMSLNLTMVTMVNQTDPHGLPNASAKKNLDNVTNPTYHWSPDVQGIILSSIFYGTVIVQVPAGYFSGIYPIKPLLGFGLFLSSVLSLCIPPIAEVGATALILCRVVQGMAQGVAGAAQHHIWVKWAPPLERGRLASVSLSGFLLGPFIVLLATGFICEHQGWPVVFYISGAYGCATSLFWFILFYNEPKDHPCISISEKDYIASSLAQQVSSSGYSLPIKAIFQSLPLWAIVFVATAMLWTANLLATYTPTFIHTMFHVPVGENGLLSSLPSLVAYFFGILSGQLGDFFLSRNILRRLTVRKLFTALGTFSPAVFSLCLLYLSFNFHSTIVFLILLGATSSFNLVGLSVNVLDIAPRYCGFLNGIISLIGMIGGLLSATITGIMLSQDPEFSWHKIFLLAAAFNLVSIIFYLIFAEADVQDWAKESQDTRL
ncbi:sodium-dependent phosphate transport protein 1-like [Ctenodactylus gundi]